MQQVLTALPAAIGGAIGGWLFFRLWRGLLPPDRSRAFWSSVPRSVRGMVTTEEPAEVLHHYRDLIASTARYAGRNTLAVLVAMLPASAIFLLMAQDLEWPFFIAATLGSLAAAAWRRTRSARKP